MKLGTRSGSADVKLTVGIDTAGSWTIIDSDMKKVLDHISKKNYKVKVGLNTSVKTEWTSQIKSLLSDISKKDFSVKISHIDIGASALNDFKKQLNGVVNKLSIEKGYSISLDSKETGIIASQVKQISAATEEAIRKTAEFEARLKAINATSKALTSGYTKAKSSLGASEEDIRSIELLNNKFIEMQAAVEVLKAKGEDASNSEIAKAEMLQEELRQLILSAKERRQATAAAAKSNVDSEAEYERQLRIVNELLTQGESNLKKWSAAKNGKAKHDFDEYKDHVDVLRELKQELESTTASVEDFDNIISKERNGMKTSAANIKMLGENTKSLGDHVKALGTKFVEWYGITQIIMKAIQTIKKMVTAVKEVDTAMTELKKVTDETDATYNRFLEKASSRASELGAKVSDVVRATADFARLGFGIEDASKLADAAIIYKNVGDGIESISEASESIISTMQAFGVGAKDAITIVDKFNEVGNNFAISSQGVGEALKRSSAAMAAAGNTLDETIALVTAANTIVQNPDSVGTTLKTISMYLRAAKTEAEEAGESTVGMASSVSKLREEILSLTGNKVDIQIDEDTFKSTTQILRELAGVWGELSDITRANITELIGGKRNGNVISALMENFDLVERVIETSSNSVGSAMRENEKYLDSIEGKISQLQAAFETLSNDFIGSDIIKELVDIATQIIKVIDKVIKLSNAIGGLKTVLLWFGAYSAYTGILKFTDILSKAQGIIATIKTDAVMSGNSISSVIAGMIGPGGKIALVIAAIAGIAKGLDALIVTYDEQVKKVQELSEEYDKMFGVGSRYDELTNKTRLLTDEEERELAILQALREEREKALIDAQEEEYRKWQNKYGTGRNKQRWVDFDDPTLYGFTPGDYIEDAYTMDVATLDDWVKYLSEVKTQYSDNELSLNEYASALGKFIADNNEYYEQLKKYQNMEGFSEAQKDALSMYEAVIEAYSKAREDAADKAKAAERELENYRAKWAKEPHAVGTNIEDDEKYLELLEDCKEAMGELGDISAEALKLQIDGFISLKDELAEATAALEEYNKALEGGEKGDLAAQYAAAYKKFLEDWNAGKTGTNAVEAAVKLILPEEELREMGYDLQSAGELLASDLYQSIFNVKDSTDYGRNFFNYITKNMDKLRGVVSLEQTEKGTSFAYKSVSKLAKALGYSETLVNVLLDALDAYGVQIMMSSDETRKLAEEFGLVANGAETAKEKVQGIVDELAKQGRGEFEIRNILETLQAAGYINFDMTKEGLGEIISTAIEAQNAVKDADKEEAQPTISADITPALSSIDQLKKVLEDLSGKDYVVRVTTLTQDMPTGHYASGTKSARGGPALVNEKGAELISENGEAYIANGGKPAIVNLDKGAIVLDADDTKTALRSAKKKPSGRIGAYANGTKLTGALSGLDIQGALKDLNGDIGTAPTIVGIKPCINGCGATLKSTAATCWNCGAPQNTSAYEAWKRGKNASTVTVTKGQTGGSSAVVSTSPVSGTSAVVPPYSPPAYSTGGSSANTNASASTKNTKSAFEEEYDWHNHMRRIEKESDEEYLLWLEDAFVEAYANNQITMDDFRKYEEEVFDLSRDLFNDRINDLEHVNSILEKTEGNEQEILTNSERILALIETELQDAYARGLNDNDDYVQELTDQWWSVKESMEKLEESLAENAKDAVENLIDYRIDMLKKERESQKDALNKQLSDLKDFYDKQKKLLQDAYDEEEYLSEQAEKRKSVSDIEEELIKLRFDNSAWAQKRKIELNEELIRSQKELDDFERRHALEMAQETLDIEYENAAKEMETQIDAMESALNDPETIFNQALDDIRNSSEALYQEFLEYNRRFGNGNDETIREMFAAAYAATTAKGQNYNGIQVGNYTGYASGTAYASGGLHRIDERGSEYVFTSADGSRYRMLNSGDKVLNAKASDFLYRFAMSGGNIIEKMMSEAARNVNSVKPSAVVNEIRVGDIVIQGNADERTVSEIRRAQRDNMNYILKELSRLNK